MISPDNHSPDRTDDLEHRLRARYLDAGDTLDPVTLGRLRAARRTALQAAHRPARVRRLQRVLLPTGAFAVIALATLMVWQPSTRHPATAAPRAAAAVPLASDTDNELPPDPDSTDPKLYQDLAFYDWLAANDTGKGPR